ncbi:MAG TPA: GH1 family beta-glucosidase, partial [Actinomycetota bacterium]|nr:GH1 family beta-glucosidase [Actinomycetota bacterium]
MSQQAGVPAPAIEQFPAGFLWGAATAAYQIEGAATEGGRGPSIWDTFCATPGRVYRGDTGEIACDHYHRWSEDLDLIAWLGLGAYRLSLSWSRLQPAGRGPLNPAAVGFYRQLLQGLRDRGVRPFVTLYHWDMPQALEDEGGWPARDTALRFGEYAGLVGEALGDLAEDWITINEAWVAAFLGYGTGEHAPGRSDPVAALRAAHHLNLAHGLAVQALRAAGPGRVGTTVLVADFAPASDRDEDVAAARRSDGAANRLFLDPLFRGGYPSDMLEHYAPTRAFEVVQDGDLATIQAPMDHLGINHYHHHVVAADPADPQLGARRLPPEEPTTSFGWGITPDALRRVLVRVATDYSGLPLYITESGASFDDYVDPGGRVNDVERVQYLAGYFGAAAKAIADGVDLRGYF